MALAAWLCSSCGYPASPPPPRLVVLYATCSLNKDFLSPYDPAVGFTPHLDAFAEEARVFLRHQSESGQSGTAFASIFSGTQADHHGVFSHPTRLREDVELIGETFQRRGFEVVAWLAQRMASEELRYAQGAERGDVYDAMLTGRHPRLRAVLDRLARNDSDRALLVTNFTLTHGPYRDGRVGAFCRHHPEECTAFPDREAFQGLIDFYRENHILLSYDFPASAERWALSGRRLSELVAVTELLYRANVWFLDQRFGELIEEIRRRGLLEQSLIVFTADHGETLFREGTLFKWTHGHQLAPEVLNVPLLIRSPGVAPGSYAEVTRSIDLLPTIAGLAGIPSPDLPEGAGVDLSAVLLGDAPPPALRAFSHTNLLPKPVVELSRTLGLFRSFYPRVDPELMWAQLRQHDRVYQLRRTADAGFEPAVFDLAEDPHARGNLYDPDDAQQQRALREVERYRQRLIEAYHRFAGTTDRVSLERQEELLRSLGYID